MKRPSFDSIFMSLALKLAERSTCTRLQVGAVITSIDHRYVYGVGYNANASGLEHKCDNKESPCGCLHAECNAIINCNVDRDKPKLVYCTFNPCINCAKMIINLGNVTNVYYHKRYRDSKGKDLLIKSGIQCMPIEVTME